MVLTLNLEVDKIRMQHALIVVGNNVGNSRKADVFSTFFVKIRLPLAIKVGSGAIGRKPFQPRESLLDLMAITLWRGGRAVEGARLESVCRFTPTEGSNPSLSATPTVGVNWQEFVKPRITVVSSQGHFNLSAEILR